MSRSTTTLGILMGMVGACTQAPSGTSADGSLSDAAASDSGVIAADASPVDLSLNAATCIMPSLEDHHSGFLPENPSGDWDMAPSCLHDLHDAIIILGCPSESDGTASPCQIERVTDALAFSLAGFGDNFIVTGAAVANEHVEADSLRALLIADGVSSDRIFVEPLAEHTDENIYWSTQIMVAQGWDSALVVSEARHLLYSAVCDANCCVELGRLTTFEYMVGSASKKAASYLLTPPAAVVTDAEQTQIKRPTKIMCSNLDSRRSCADNFQL